MMSDEHDFAIDAGDLRSAAEPAAGSSAAPARDSAPAPASELGPTPPPMVVIQYRNRGLHMALLPPLLILLTALVITSYQRQARLRPLVPHPATTTKAAEPAHPEGRGRIIMVEGSVTGSAVEPIVVRAATPPPPPPSVASPAFATPPIAPAAEPKAQEDLARVDKPQEPGPFSPFDLEAREGLRPLPPEPRREVAAEPPLEPPVPPTSAAKENFSPDSPELAFRVVGEQAPAGRAPEPEPEVSKEQVLAGIQAEAEQKKADQENLKREMTQAKVREYYEVFRKLQADRPSFHNDLRRLLQELGDGAGEEINDLCDRYGRNTLPEVHTMVGVTLKRSGARLKREAKIEWMRSHGVPEPVILDHLANEQHMTMNTRGGPRDRNEVRARAARILLAYPPAAPQQSPTPITAAPRSVAGVGTPPVPRTVRPQQ